LPHKGLYYRTPQMYNTQDLQSSGIKEVFLLGGVRQIIYLMPEKNT